MIVNIVHDHDVGTGVKSGEVLSECSLTLTEMKTGAWRGSPPGCCCSDDMLASPLAAERIDQTVACPAGIVSGRVNADR